MNEGYDGHEAVFPGRYRFGNFAERESDEKDDADDNENDRDDGFAEGFLPRMGPMESKVLTVPAVELTEDDER